MYMYSTYMYMYTIKCCLEKIYAMSVKILWFQLIV